MTPSKKPFIATNVSPETLDRLKERAVERGQTLRDYCADALENACSERSDVSPGRSIERSGPGPERSGERSPERSSGRSGLAPGAVGQPEYAPALVRTDEHEMRGTRWTRDVAAEAPPICRGDCSLPTDPREAAELIARELQLVRRTGTWRDLVREGEFETELHSLAEPEEDDPESEAPEAA